ncbi:RsmB/NOP family class I SAM-dependent RNA methyltransferase [Smaragdicoccus niigatensis]|uniref:RsmB/NOP family class I SAM-dependent RNA methyltransferase n=1 Tax=Smaragdicoccus niigatensis TaxID=359359 RepID=UPI00037F1CA7|nr:transcription antitermination factor NusB [Smaragdicoccus niigatensis]
MSKPPRQSPPDPVREVARDVLRAVRERDAYANLVLPKMLTERGISGRDAAFATEIAYGASRAQGFLDSVIEKAAGRSVSAIDGKVLDVLRIGAYQLLRTRTGAHAAVATSVDLVRSESGRGAAGFANAVLRRVSEKTPEQWVDAIATTDPLDRLSVEFAHPRWIVDSFAATLSGDELRDALAADDARPKVHLVARPGAISREDLLAETGGLPGPYSPFAVHLDGGDPAAFESVRNGAAAVQDEGSQLIALALADAPLTGSDSGRWLDLCAGPGGKAALLGSIAAQRNAHVDAVEQSKHRAELVRKAVAGLPVDVLVADGRATGFKPGFDRVLVDAPCTGLGALRRRPEARWRRTEKDVADLVRLQKQLLAAAVGLVRPGGVVVYSTCSPHLLETVGVVNEAVSRFGLEVLDADQVLPGVPNSGAETGIQLWPHRHGTDAMYLAALRKPEK